MKGSARPLLLTIFAVAPCLTAQDVPFRRGDSNIDGKSDISDAVNTLGILFLGLPVPDCRDALDTNDDGKVDISDPVALLNFLFLGSPAPKQPYPDCGRDPSADATDCVSYRHCNDPARDTDADGASDVIEGAVGTDAQDPADNPEARGYLVFVVPRDEDPMPQNRRIVVEDVAWHDADLYFLVDRSGSMSGEIASLKNTIGAVLDNLACAPNGNGIPGECIPDLWAGVGSIGYSCSSPYTNHLDLQPNPSLVGPSILSSEPQEGGCTSEAHLAALWSTFTGSGSAGLCGPTLQAYAGRDTCSGSRVGDSGLGYPCFRPEALRAAIVFTDEPPSTQFSCPGFATTLNVARSRDWKIIGILGSDAPPQTRTDLERLAIETGTVDARAGNTPLVFDGSGANAAPAVATAVRALVNGTPIAMVSGTLRDERGDSVDAIGAFVDHFELAGGGAEGCVTEGWDDSDGDGHADTMNSLLPGDTACWTIVAKTNSSIAPAPEPLVFRAVFEVTSAGGTTHARRDVFFVVPP